MRDALKVIHRRVALVVSLLLVATVASGSLLVFEGAIDRGLNPQLFKVTASGPLMPIDTLVARVESQYPGKTAGVVAMSPVAGRSWSIGIGQFAVFVNPYTGAIVGMRTPQDANAALARRLHLFHVRLFAGERGQAVVGALTAVTLFLLVTGLILWWPDKIFRVTRRGSWKRINFDLHHLFGVAAFPILLVVTSTGLLIHYAPLTRMVRSLDTTAFVAPEQPEGPVNAPRVSFDRVLAAARDAMPGATPLLISMVGAENPVTVAMRFPEDRTPGGRSRVFIDRYSGALLGTLSTREAQMGTRIDNLKRSLHTGDVLGKPSQALWLLTMVALIGQVVTGLLMWWNARKSR